MGTITDPPSLALLHLLQLANPALPVGAYSYSEGLEYLSQTGQLQTHLDLRDWLVQELQSGAIAIETAIVHTAYHCVIPEDFAALRRWNSYLSALRETEELRLQSLQMGRALARLLVDVQPELQPWLALEGDSCHFAIAFAVAAAYWRIDVKSALLGYLHSWSSNLINAGIRLIPLGQTVGQSLLMDLYPQIQQTVERVLTTPVHEITTCSWGVAIASMNHEHLYSRLFRS